MNNEAKCAQLSTQLNITNTDLIVAAYFNCHPNSRLYNVFTALVKITTDINKQRDVFTYYSDNGNNMSWIDNFLCSSSVDVRDVIILT